MAGLTLLVLVQTGLLLYLLYRVHRLEQWLSQGGRPWRRGQPPADGGRKVIPLLKQQIPPGPFKGKPTPPSTDPKK
ncbi:MAG: hypothetical protein ACOY93_20240 [Bacillota bacterium]